MKVSKLSAVIAGAALSVGALALAPVEAAAQAKPSTHSTGLCTRLVGIGHHYTVIAFPCDFVKRCRHSVGELTRIELNPTFA